MLFALFKKWWGWDIFHPTRTYSSLKFNLKCDFRVLSSFIFYHHHLWYIVVICRTKNLTFLWASFRKWLHLLAANDLKEQRNWICQKFLMDFPQPELYLPPLIFTKLSFFWDTLYSKYTIWVLKVSPLFHIWKNMCKIFRYFLIVWKTSLICIVSTMFQFFPTSSKTSKSMFF